MRCINGGSRPKPGLSKGGAAHVRHTDGKRKHSGGGTDKMAGNIEDPLKKIGRAVLPWLRIQL